MGNTDFELSVIERRLIKNMIGRMHVGTPAEDIEKEIRAKMSKDCPPDIADHIVKYALRIHRGNQNTYYNVARGKF